MPTIVDSSKKVFSQSSAVKGRCHPRRKESEWENGDDHNANEYILNGPTEAMESQQSSIKYQVSQRCLQWQVLPKGQEPQNVGMIYQTQHLNFIAEL